MSGMKEFLAKAKSDEKFRADLMKETSPEGVLARAKRAGFSITRQELMAAVPGLDSSGELTEEQLEGVSGGGIMTYIGKIWAAITPDTTDSGSGGAGGVRA